MKNNLEYTAIRILDTTNMGISREEKIEAVKKLIVKFSNDEHSRRVQRKHEERMW